MISSPFGGLMAQPDHLQIQETAAGRLALAFELHDMGVAMMRQRLRSQHPEATAAALDRLLRTWLHTRPGAHHGDGAPGRVIPWERR